MRSELAYIATRAHIEDLHRRAAAERFAADARQTRGPVLVGIIRRRFAAQLSGVRRALHKQPASGLQPAARR